MRQRTGALTWMCAVLLASITATTSVHAFVHGCEQSEVLIVSKPLHSLLCRAALHLQAVHQHLSAVCALHDSRAPRASASMTC